MHTVDASSGSEAQVEFRVWQPVLCDRAIDKGERQLCISLDDAFLGSSWEFKIFARVTRSFPGSFTFIGSECGAAIKQHRQRIEYIAAQRSKFIASAPREQELDSTAPPQQQRYEVEKGTTSHPLHVC